MTFRRAIVAVLSVLALTTLTACAAEANVVAGAAAHPAGFWLGLWHGLICPIAFIVSLFNHRVGIYEVLNNGGWYNFGFVLGLSVAFGGSSRATTAPSRRRGGADRPP
ncbi:MAG TPA: hypothetical protein VHN80_01380, partial [Kineosporiaceae bacterium]|nr:hypothetical protein [Kineosporiaceae bacterium]